jgi:hypothetical protein
MIDPLFKLVQKVYETWTFIKAPKFNAPPILPFYTLATIPDATFHEGAILYVSDASSGARFQGSNGIAWVNLG